MTPLLPFPPPYKAWITLSNDPDNTAPDGWRELHQVIWEELGIPFADSIFLRSVNDTLPDQVSVENLPESATAHAVDTLHTWGDYILSDTEVFHRSHAEEGIGRLESMGLEPRVWVDHSFFQGNLLHASRLGARPSIRDASGHEYANSFYTLDLIRQAGVRYIWDGGVRRSFARPGRPTPRTEYYADRAESSSKGQLLGVMDQLGKPFWRWLSAERFDYDSAKTQLYFPHTFPDGQTFYCFGRYGAWPLADIRGFGELTAPPELERMIDQGAACILYTHLGKRHSENANDPKHIPASTRESLEAIRDRHQSGDLMVSSTAHLLDYSVLRDHAEIQGSRVNFRADGIRWPTLTPADLSGHRFGTQGISEQALEVSCEGQDVPFKLVESPTGVTAFEIPAGVTAVETAARTPTASEGH